ncbi:MAG: NUDIX hydrolase [Defluviitaleaceae bacterium]|nr:NUDIX hydrolase [Defluviitaleaceae bacterium]
MIDAAISTTIVSCGGVVIYRNKVLVLYKNQNGRSMGWVLPKGSVEPGETHKQAALREVKEESGVSASLVRYLGETGYTFKAEDEIFSKTVHWYLMTTNSFYCKPQAEEFFADVGFYKQHEAYHLLKFNDEKQIMRRAFYEYEKEPRRKKSGNAAYKKHTERMVSQ